MRLKQVAVHGSGPSTSYRIETTGGIEPAPGSDPKVVPNHPNDHVLDDGTTAVGSVGNGTDTWLYSGEATVYSTGAGNVSVSKGLRSELKYAAVAAALALAWW